MRRRVRLILLFTLVIGLLALASVTAQRLQAAALLQATPTISVPEFATVRSGPGTVYDRVGSLGAGATAPAIGRSESGEWIQIVFSEAPGGKGWVYAPAVEFDPSAVNDLPVIQTPPTATLPPTPADQSGLFTPTPYTARLPTFTPAPEVTRPQFTSSVSVGGGFPPMLITVALLAVGLIGGVMAFIRRSA